MVIYAEAQWDAVNTAVINFLGNASDPKASLDLSIEYIEGVVSDIRVTILQAEWLIS